MSRYNVAELAQTLFEEAGDALFLFDPDTEQILDVNPMGQRLTGLSRHDLLQLSVTALFQADTSAHMRRLKKAFEITGLFHSQEGFRLRHVKHGEWIDVNISITRLHTEPKTLGLITARDVREQREAFERLRQKEAELQRVLASISDYVWSAERDAEGRWCRLYYSPAVEHITGHAVDYYLAGPERWLSTVHPDDRERVQRAFADVKRGEAAYAVEEYRILRPDGATRWVRDSIRLRQKGEGKALIVDGVVADITQHVEDAQHLRASEERFRALVEAGTDAVALCTAEGMITYVTPPVLPMLGYAPEELRGVGGFSLVHPADVGQARAFLTKIVVDPAGAGRINARVRHKDGGYRLIEATVTNRLADPAIGTLVCNFRDVTARFAAEEALRQSEKRYRLLVQNMTDVIWTADLEMRLTYVSPSIERFSGFTADEWLSRPIEMRVTPDSLAELRASLQHHLAEDSRPDAPVQARTIEYQSVTKEGLARWVESRVSFLRDEAGRPIGIIGVTRDIEERRRAELAVRQAEENYRSIFENAVEGIYQSTLEGRFLSVNPMLARISGYPSPAEFLAAVDLNHEFYLEPERRAEFVRMVAERGAVTGLESQVCRRDGSVRWISENARAVRDANGAVIGFEGSLVDITDRKQAEDALRAAEEKYRSLFENAPEGIYQSRLDGSFTLVNPALAQLFGYDSPAAFLARSDPQQEGYADPARRSEFLAQMSAQGTVAGFESPIRRRDGTIIWVSENARAVHDASGACVGFEGTIEDITARKCAEQELVRRNRQLAALNQIGQSLSRLADPAAILGLIHQTVGRVLDNRNFHIAQYDECHGRIDFPFYVIEGQRVERESRPFSDGLTEHVIRTKAPILIQSDMLATLRALGIGSYGQPARCYLSVPMIAGERVIGTITVQDYEREGVFGANELELLSTFAAQAAIALENARLYEAMQIELSERKQAEQAVRVSEAKYRTLLENLEQGVFLKDRELRFVAANGRMCQALGGDEPRLLGKTDADFFPPDIVERFRAADLRVLAEAQRVESEEDIRWGDGAHLVRIIKTPVRDSEGRVTGVLGIVWDVTQQRRLEAQLRHVQKMDAIGHLAGGIAHDFNNLLTAILGNISLSLAGYSDQDPAREPLAAAEKATLRAADLVRKLLSFSRRSMLRLAPVQLPTIVAESLQILRPSLPPGITIDVHAGPDASAVCGDASHLGQVIVNLCLNARDAMVERGRLDIAIENVVITEQHCQRQVRARPGEFVRLRIADTGHGIPDDIRNRVFEPFFTTKEPGKGTGLGLAMVFGIVEQHKGWIECHSEVGAGTQFDVYLPRSEQAATAAEPELKRPPPLRGHETILLVEDEPMIRNLARVILQRYGYRVLQACDGLEALEVFVKEREQIDLVLLDLTMPRLSGSETLVRLRELDADVRVLFSSGYSSDLAEVSRAEHVAGFVGKPYRPEELAHAVRAALDKCRRSRRAAAPRNGQHAAGIKA